MISKGMTVPTVKNKMKRLHWWKLHDDIDFKDNRHRNLIYHTGKDILCFWFEDGKLKEWMRTEED